MFGLFNNFDVYAFSLRIEEVLSHKPGAVFAERNLKKEDFDVLDALMPDIYILYMLTNENKALVAVGRNGPAAVNALREFFHWVKKNDPRGWAEDGHQLLAWGRDMRERIIAV